MFKISLIFCVVIVDSVNVIDDDIVVIIVFCIVFVVLLCGVVIGFCVCCKFVNF